MARSDVLVSTDWAQRNLDTESVVFVEVDEDTGAYDTGHIPGAIKLDWKKDLQDPVKRDFVDAQQFSKLLSERGISVDDTVVLYGGNNNWFAAYAYWYFKLYGHDKIKLLDGVRKKWELDGRTMSADPVNRPATSPPVHDSATATRHPRSTSNCPTTASRLSPRAVNASRPTRAHVSAAAAATEASDGGGGVWWRSSSPRCCCSCRAAGARPPLATSSAAATAAPMRSSAVP